MSKHEDLERLFYWVVGFLNDYEHTAKREDADEIDFKAVEWLRSFKEMRKIVGDLKKENRELRFHSREEVMKKYPELVGHLICVSLGYATPSVAADIILAYTRNKDHYCEWIDACYKGKPKPPIEQAYTGRRYHNGYMSEIKNAKALVARAIETGKEPTFASWF